MIMETVIKVETALFEMQRLSSVMPKLQQLCNSEVNAT